MNVEEMINAGFRNYEKAIELLDRGDYYDAAEKAWSGVEYLRKAFLVALGVPYEKARTINYGLPLFGRLLRALGLKKLLRRYEWFDYKLHIMGFYERLTPEDEIEIIIRRYVRQWLEEMRKIVLKLKGMSIDEILDIYNRIVKLKQEVLKKSEELAVINNEFIKKVREFASNARRFLRD